MVLRLAVFSSCAAAAVSGPGASARTREPAPIVRDAGARVAAMPAQADGELDRLAVKAESAVERYHGELVKLERARASYADIQGRLAEAARRVQEAQAAMAAFAAGAYKGDTGYSAWTVLAGGNDGPQAFMDRAALVEILARRRAGAMQDLQAARNVAELFRRQAEESLREQQAATERAAKAKKAAHRAVAERRAALQRIEAHKRGPGRRPGSARATPAAWRPGQGEAARAGAIGAARPAG
ncbi:hypothetical protein ACRB68_40070 [Actinomadura sp. RB68]|uniref:NlpC/P60 family protein n=1 Tax=Actinomadura macrotermitis TaxID=2585200 RepID=A0A7K0BXL0_9ACTN|nr:hypothetical protein [Actinomadura macrotermitis]